MKLAKFLEAIGIACVMIGLVQGIYGDMWAELYLLLAGIVLFFVGWLLEKREMRRAQSTGATEAK